MSDVVWGLVPLAAGLIALIAFVAFVVIVTQLLDKR